MLDLYYYASHRKACCMRREARATSILNVYPQKLWITLWNNGELNR